MKSSALEINNLSYHINNQVILEQLNFSLQVGELAYLIGANGAGKTSLFRILSGLISTVEIKNNVKIFGQSIYKSNAYLKYLGLVFQHRTIDLHLTVQQNMTYYATLHGLNKKTAQYRIERELDYFGLSDKATRVVYSLSGGELRRVEIARSLITEPQLLLLDEPNASIDIENRILLNKKIKTLNQDKNITILWITHLVEDLALNSRILFLKQGKIVQDYILDKNKKDQINQDLIKAFDISQ